MDLSHLHNSLCEAVRIVNEVYSWLMLCSAAMEFVIAVNAIYFLIVEHIGLSSEHFSVAMWITIPYIFYRPILQIYSCDRLQVEVGLNDF